MSEIKKALETTQGEIKLKCGFFFGVNFDLFQEFIEAPPDITDDMSVSFLSFIYMIFLIFT